MSETGSTPNVTSLKAITVVEALISKVMTMLSTFSPWLNLKAIAMLNLKGWYQGWALKVS